MWWDRYLFMVDLNRLLLTFVDHMWIKSSGRLIGKCNQVFVINNVFNVLQISQDLP